MEEKDSVYGTALNNLARSKSELTFTNRSVPTSVDTLVAMLRNSKISVILYEEHLDSLVYQDDEFINALKFFLKNDGTVKIIVNENRINEKFKWLIKKYALNIQIKKATAEFIAELAEGVKENCKLIGFFLVDKSYRLVIDDGVADCPISLCNFNDTEHVEAYTRLTNKYFDHLEKINILDNSLPTVSEVLSKYQPNESGLYTFDTIEMIKLIEHIQGK